jgi:alcohol/geraniol dehydrogenase (NADP+)
VAAFPLIEGQKNIGGSAIGSNAEIHVMLRFSAEHKIAPTLEPYPMKEVTRALDRCGQIGCAIALCWRMKIEEFLLNR